MNDGVENVARRLALGLPELRELAPQFAEFLSKKGAASVADTAPAKARSTVDPGAPSGAHTSSFSARSIGLTGRSTRSYAPMAR